MAVRDCNRLLVADQQEEPLVAADTGPAVVLPEQGQALATRGERQVADFQIGHDTLFSEGTAYYGERRPNPSILTVYWLCGCVSIMVPLLSHFVE